MILLYGLCNGAAGYDPEGRNYAKLLAPEGRNYPKLLANVGEDLMNTAHSDDGYGDLSHGKP
ncbi:hypothetical protein WN944_026833 [Citrus x changshan-huyou]|uniref:Uncharacterized protein n=1 Tax=Citrus x changshan-huyou TaxID=2935761 RepID=A0AAP0Q9A6_9ROSI